MADSRRDVLPRRSVQWLQLAQGVAQPRPSLANPPKGEILNVYLVVRIAKEVSPLVEPIGVTLDESAAIAMCHGDGEGVVELEAGRRYEPGAVLPEDVRCIFPHCEKFPGWRTPSGLEVTRHDVVKSDDSRLGTEK